MVKSGFFSVVDVSDKVGSGYLAITRKNTSEVSQFSNQCCRAG